MDNQHYICTGSCKGVSDTQVNCGATTCEKHDQPLTPCTCDAPEHQPKQHPMPTETTAQ